MQLFNQLLTIKAQATNDNFSFNDVLGKNLVLYFYPKDNTAGCTKQAQDFAQMYSQFLVANTEVIGVSRDSLKSHHNFKTKLNLPFELISDGDETLCQLFNVIKLKKMYGREYLGIERSTFVFDVNGNLVKEWRIVAIKNHVAEVLSLVTTLSK